jgi:CubicO group peptidase (beta-lactamase class C family)
MKKLLLLLCLLPLCLLLVFWALAPRQVVSSDKSTSLDDFISALMEEVAIPGLAIAKISEGELALVETYGMANIATGESVDENTLFNIASISKPIMGLALLRLVGQGKLELDRDINDYLSFNVDNPHTTDEIITLRHLVSHSSGINDYYNYSSYADNEDSEISLQDHLKSIVTPAGKLYDDGRYFLEQKPGEAREYSNLAAGIAGQLVEEVSGISLAEYSKKTLFPSLGMTQTSWLLHDLDLSKIAVPYEVQQCIPYTLICANTESPKLNFLIGTIFKPPVKYKQYLPYPHFGNPQYPDGGIRTSIKELSLFLVYLLNNSDKLGNKLLSDAAYNEMFKLQLPADVSTRQRFFWRDRAGLTGHMGSDLGVFSAMYFDLESKTGYIILMNRGVDSGSDAAMGKIAARLMAWDNY